MTTTTYFTFTGAHKNSNVNGVLDITPDELFTHLEHVHIVDVRRPDEWVGEFGHIEQAALITLDTLPVRANEIPTHKTIVFVCRSGARSAQATAWAKENGFSNVYNLQGGMIEWTNKKYKTVEKGNA